MNGSLEAKMLSQNSGLKITSLLGGSVTKTSYHNHLSSIRRLAFRWWGNSASSDFKNQSSSEYSKVVGEPWPRKLWVSRVLGGIMTFLLIFHGMNFGQVERQKDMLATMCDERARMLEDQFAMNMNHANGLAQLMSAFHVGKQPWAIDQKLIAEYAGKTCFRRPWISGIAYAKNFLHSEREKFEGQQGWKIKSMKRSISPIHEEYAPVMFTQDTNAYIQSLDMMSGPEDREIISRSRATGKVALTSPFTLESNHRGVVFVFTVYRTNLSENAKPEERIEETSGYLGGAFDVELLVENLLHQRAGKQAIVVNVYDTNNASQPMIIYGQAIKLNGSSHVSKLNFGDPFRKHEMLCRFVEEPLIPSSAITIAVGMIAIAFLIRKILERYSMLR